MRQVRSENVRGGGVYYIALGNSLSLQARADARLNTDTKYLRTVMAEQRYAKGSKEVWVQLQKSTPKSLLATPSTRGWGHHDVHSKQGSRLDTAVAAAVLAVTHLASANSL